MLVNKETSTLLHKYHDYTEKEVFPKNRFLRSAMLRIASVEMTKGDVDNAN